MNQAILDKGWGEMRRQLACKLSWSGGASLRCTLRNTSRTDRDRFSCRSCGYQEHADTNAAQAICQRGLLALDISEKLRPERSWQPEEPSAQAMARQGEENNWISRQVVLA